MSGRLLRTIRGSRADLCLQWCVCRGQGPLSHSESPRSRAVCIFVFALFCLCSVRTSGCLSSLRRFPKECIIFFPLKKNKIFPVDMLRKCERRHDFYDVYFLSLIQKRSNSLLNANTIKQREAQNLSPHGGPKVCDAALLAEDGACKDVSLSLLHTAHLQLHFVVSGMSCLHDSDTFYKRRS